MSPTQSAAVSIPRLGAVALLVSSMLYGCWPVVCRTAAGLSSVPLPAARQSVVVVAVMLAALVPLALRHRRRLQTQQPSASSFAPTDHWRFALLGVTDALNNLCFFAALQLTSVAVAVLCHYASPLLVTALSPVVLGERRRQRTAIAVAGATIGLLLVLQPWATRAPADLMGAGFGLLSAVFYAASVMLGKALVGDGSSGDSRRGVVEVAGWPTLVSLPVVVAVACCGTGGIGVEAAPLLVLVGGAIVCGVVPLLLFYAGLQRLPASQASVLTMIEPVTAVVVGATILGEPLTAVVVVGGATVLAAVLFVRRG